MLLQLENHSYYRNVKYNGMEIILIVYYDDVSNFEEYKIKIVSCDLFLFRKLSECEVKALSIIVILDVNIAPFR